MSSRRLQDMSSRRLQDMKRSSRRLQNQQMFAGEDLEEKALMIFEKLNETAESSNVEDCH